MNQPAILFIRHLFNHEKYWKLLRKKVYNKENRSVHQSTKEEPQMNEVYDFLKACETYYLATMEGDQPGCVRLERLTSTKAGFIFRRVK